MKHVRTATRRTELLGSAAALSLLTVADAYAAETYFTYDNCSKADPSCGWHLLSDEFRLCGGDTVGQQQSPVDLRDGDNLHNDVESIDYTMNSLVVEKNGHAIKVRHEKPGKSLGSIQIDGQRFHLKQFHFHTPSEHTHHGHHYAMEIHFVHVSDNGKAKAVISVFVSRSADNMDDNSALDTILDQALNAPHGPSMSFELNAGDLFTGMWNWNHYRLTGSLTTPPCTQGVNWRIFYSPIQASSQQIDEFEAIMGQNNRPLQAPNGRNIGAIAP